MRPGPLPLAPLFAAALGALVLFWWPGASLSDDVAQAAGLHALRDGHLWVGGDLGPGYEPFLQGAFRHEAIPEPGGRAAPSGSTLLNVLALPLLLVLEGLDAVLGYDLALAAAASLLAGLGAWRGWSLWRDPASPRRRWAAIAPAAILLPGSALRNTDLPAAPFLEFAALELASMAFAALGAVFLFDLLRRFLPEAHALACAALYAFATPAFFWALGVKYHAASMALVVVAAWCLRDGHRAPAARMALGFAVAGLAVWNQLPLGILLAASLALLAVPAVRLGLRGFLARAGASVAGLAVGVAPDLGQRFLLGRADLSSQFALVGPGQDATDGTVSASLRQEVQEGRLSHTLATDPAGALEAVWQTLVWTDWRDVSVALSFLCAAPFVAAAFAVPLVRGLRRRLPGPLLAWALLYPALLLGVMGSYLLNLGEGIDMRHAATLWPAAILLAAPLLSEAWGGRTPGWWRDRALAVAAAVAAAVLVSTLLLHAAFGTFTPQGQGFDQTLLFRCGGFAMALSLFGAALVAARRASPGAVRVRDAALAAALGIPVAFQAVTVAIYGKLGEPLSGPWVAWPLDLLSRGVGWMMWA